MNGVSLTVVEARADRVTGRVVFEAGFAGFDGHFPAERGGAILPGFLQVEAAVEFLGLALGQRVALQSVEAGKFLRGILPGEILDVQISSAEGAWDVVLVMGEAQCSRFRIRVSKI